MMEQNDIDIENVYTDIDMNFRNFSGMLGVDEVKFIKYFSNKQTFKLPQDEVVAISKKFRLKLDKKRKSIKSK